jgi:hypothetical protein
MSKTNLGKGTKGNVNPEHIKMIGEDFARLLKNEGEVRDMKLFLTALDRLVFVYRFNGI